MPALRLPRSGRILAVPAAVVLLIGLGLPGVALADDGIAAGDHVVGELVQAFPEHHDYAAAVARADEGPLSWIETPDGQSVRVSTDDLTAQMADDHPAGQPADQTGGLPVGATVDVVVGKHVADQATTKDGMEPALQVTAADVVSAAPAAQPPVAAAYTDTVTIVMMIPARGAAEPGRTLAAVETAVNGPVADFWRSQSGGVIQLQAAAGNNPAWVQATVPCTDPSGLWSQAASAAGWTPGTGRHLLVYLPRNSYGCAYGLAEVGSSVTGGGRLYVTDVATSVIAHELGHNFGLGHSSGQQCDGGTESGSCRTESYRDYYDVMGYSWQQVGTLNVTQEVRLGFLPAAQQQAVAIPGRTQDFTLDPVSGTTGTRALKLTAPDGTVYWLEYRTASGQDAWLASPPLGLQTGVLLRRAAPFPTSNFYSDTSMLLDPTPSAASGWGTDYQVALPTGVPVNVAGANFTVTLESSDATAATVRISQVAGDTACAGRTTVPMSGVSLLTAGSTTSALVVGLDRGLWLRPIDGSSTSWQSLGGGVTYGPAAASDGTTSYVFVAGLTGALWYRANSGSGWGPWTSLGGYLTASPAAASLGAGEVRVFARGLDGQLWSRELTNGDWSNWRAGGGFLTSPPTATADLDANRIDVQVRGTDGYTYQQTLGAGDGAAAYQRLGIMACSAVALGAGRVSTDPASGAIVDSRQAPTLLEPTGSHPLGGAFTSNPAVKFFGGQFVVAGRGTDNALWLYDGRSGGSGWRSLGGYVV